MAGFVIPWMLSLSTCTHVAQLTGFFTQDTVPVPTEVGTVRYIGSLTKIRGSQATHQSIALPFTEKLLVSAPVPTSTIILRD